MYYTLFKGDSKILDMHAYDKKDAKKQLKTLMDVFANMNDPYSIMADIRDHENGFIVDIIATRGMATKTVLYLVEQ